MIGDAAQPYAECALPPCAGRTCAIAYGAGNEVERALSGEKEDALSLRHLPLSTTSCKTP